MNIKTLTALPLTALVLAAALTGCSGTTQTADTPTQAVTASAVTMPAASSAPAPVTTPGPVPAGATVAANLKTVTLTDGTTVAIDPTQPLPAAVLADLAKPVQEQVAQAVAAGTPMSGSAAIADAASISEATGRAAIIVIQTRGALTSGGQVQTLYGAVGGVANDLGRATVATSKASTVAKLDAWMAAHGGAALYDVIDATAR